MQKLLGDEAEALFAALGEDPRAGLRLNTLKLETPPPLPFTLNPISWCHTGFVIPSNHSAGKHPYHAAGLYYLQEPSAMAVAEALAPKQGKLILDLAAAPGGKTTHLVSLADDKSIVVANDVSRGRTKSLLENLERWGATKAMVTSEEVSRLAKTWGPIFDRVLLDAPCSGEGMFRKSEDALKMWSKGNVLGCAKRQSKLLDEAAQLVKEGGYLAYSTCTFAPEEDEIVIAEFLENHPNFSLEPLDLPELSSGRPDWLPETLATPDLIKTARAWPHKLEGEGHFVALFRKNDGETKRFKPARFRPVPHNVAKLWRNFQKEVLQGALETLNLTLFGNKLFSVPEGVPDIKGLNVLRTGLWLATVHKNRLEPSHSLALALSKERASKITHLNLEPDDERLALYLQGHVLEEAGESGWVLVTVSGYPLGWGKRSGRTVKNAYPKGLRRTP